MAPVAPDGLIGRDADLAALTRTLDAATAGAGALLLLGGPAGIGKTSVGEVLVGRARAAGFAVAWTACWESAALPPFAPWTELLDQLGAPPLPAVGADELLDADAEASRSRTISAVALALRQAAARQPLLVVVDDLHWADPDTLALFGRVAPQLRTLRAVVVATYRTEEAAGESAFAARFAELARHARRHELRPLPDADLHALVERVAGRTVPGAAVAHLRAWTGGNPLFTLELARELDDSGRLDALDGPADGGADAMRQAPPVPPSVAAVFEARLARCTAACAEVLAVAAIAGDVVPISTLAGVVDRQPADVLVLLDEAEGLGLTREVAPARWGFTHPILRATVLHRLRVATRVRLHARVGAALEAARAAGERVDLAALAYHFTRAAPGGTAAAAVRFATEAGQEAMRTGAFASAAAHFAQALDLVALAPGAGDRGELLLAVGEARVAGGERDAARSVLAEAAADARRTGRTPLLARAALALAAGGGFEVELFDPAQVDLLREAVAVLDEARDPALVSRCLARLSVATSLREDVAARAALADRAIALARAAGDDGALAAALAAACDAHAGPDDTDLRRRESGEIVTLAHRRGDRRAELLGRRLHLVALLEAGDVGAATQEVDAYEALAREVREPVFSWYVPLWRSALAFGCGRVHDGLALAEQARVAGTAAGSVNVDILSKSQRWLFALELDDAATLRSSYDELLSWSPLETFGVQIVGAVALGAVAAGDPDEARAVLDAQQGAVRDAPRDSEWVPLLVQVADATARIGGHPLASWAYDALLPFAHRCGVDGIAMGLHGSIARSLGLLAAVLGDRPSAEEHFAAALADNERMGLRLLVARTRHDRGVALGREDDLRAARETYAALGVPGRVGALDGRLAASPVPPVAPVPAVDGGASFRRVGDTWALRWDGATAHVRDTKGVRDLAVLLARPGTDVAATDLYAAAGAPVAQSDLGEVIDEKARRAYRARLAELARVLDEADARGDAAASARASTERDALLAQLSGALGLGGRARRSGGTAERARTAVTARVKDAIRRIEAVHPSLARHLTRSVRTGTSCRYDPDPPVRWDL